MPESPILGPSHVFVDWLELPGFGMAPEAIIRGDRSCGSIEAASILAKVHRDHLMEVTAARSQLYGFARHNGYSTAAHREAIRMAPARSPAAPSVA